MEFPQYLPKARLLVPIAFIVIVALALSMQTIRHLSSNTICAGGTHHEHSGCASIFEATFTNSSPCSDFLNRIVRGSWTPKVVTEREINQVERFLMTSRGKYFVPTTLARPDSVCGNATFDFLRGLQHQALWFRPLCDPHGPTPCCYDNACVDKTVEECKCANCYDMRTPINAELAQWEPYHSDCKIVQYDQAHACGLLEGAKIYFVGDSFLRQMYVIMINLLTGNYVDSALKSNTPRGWRKYCSGWMQLLCYEYTKYIVPVCKKGAYVEHVELITHAQGPQLLSLLKQLTNTPRTFVLVGLGIHGTYNETNIWNNFLAPSVRYLQGTSGQRLSWPKLVWVTPHAPGILKTPRVPGQSYSSVVRFNAFINDKIKEAGIPLLDTFNMTDGVMSYDGAHYGFGVNMVKIQIVLNYLNQLRVIGKY